MTSLGGCSLRKSRNVGIAHLIVERSGAKLKPVSQAKNLMDVHITV
jgi:hypothetical protein